MPDLKIGDRILLIGPKSLINLDSDEQYIAFHEKMYKHIGSVGTITKLRCDKLALRTSADHEEWVWHVKWIKKLN